jgi:two-component system sensor histidine kinase UhpB
VRLEQAAGQGQILLSIADNGRGIAPEDRRKPQSFGLRGMNERARALGGTLDLAPAPGGGALVTIKIAPSSAPATIIAGTDPATDPTAPQQ